MFISLISLPSVDAHVPQNERGNVFARGRQQGDRWRATDLEQTRSLADTQCLWLRKELPRGLGSRNKRDAFSKLMVAKLSHVMGRGAVTVDMWSY